MTARKLDFVIAGAQKSGTCTLDAIFRLHPQIQMARFKETHFFDDDERDWNSPDYGVLHALFKDDDARLRAEATPSTMFLRRAARRLHAYNPNVKIVLILRDPVTRAFSSWQQEYSRGRETFPFDEAIRDARRRIRIAVAVKDQYRFFSYIERGFYADQLAYLLDFFPKRNIHCEIYEEFFRDRDAGLERIANFIGIDAFPKNIADIRVNPAHVFAYPSILTAADVAYLSDLFRDQIGAFEEFLGRPILSWRRAP